MLQTWFMAERAEGGTGCRLAKAVTLIKEILFQVKQNDKKEKA